MPVVECDHWSVFILVFFFSSLFNKETRACYILFCLISVAFLKKVVVPIQNKVNKVMCMRQVLDRHREPVSAYRRRTRHDAGMLISVSSLKMLTFHQLLILWRLCKSAPQVTSYCSHSGPKKGKWKDDIDHSRLAAPHIRLAKVWTVIRQYSFNTESIHSCGFVYEVGIKIWYFFAEIVWIVSCACTSCSSTRGSTA